jgi:aryl-alcohol dehydrogenase-like predicted oxidoreductase
VSRNQAIETSLAGIRLGLGAWSWGDRVVWQYGRQYGERSVTDAYAAAIDQGIRLVDTAEVYGSGTSERLLGDLMSKSKSRPLVATKYFPWPWRLTRAQFFAALRGSLERLQLPSIDLYQAHWPTPLLTIEDLMRWMAAAADAGLLKAIGVSNFDQGQMLRAYSALAQRGLTLVSNQVHFSLMKRDAEKSGLVARCAELGVRLIASSPLEMGLLSGKYGPEHPPPGSRGVRYASTLARLQPLLKALTEIGQDHGGKSNAQVALAWTMAKGVLPIPGAKNVEQVLDNAGAATLALTPAEVVTLDAVSDRMQ